MPCDTINTTEIDAGKFNGPIFVEALKALGLNPTHNAYKRYQFNGGSFSSETNRFTWINLTQEEAQAKTLEIKKAYSAECVKSQAKKFGWTLKTTGTHKYTLTKATL